MSIKKWLYCLLGAVGLWGQTQSEQFTGRHFYRFSMQGAAFARMADWRLEFRIHGFRAEARDHGIVGIEDNPCHFLANSLRMRCRTWNGTSNVITMDLNGRTDVRVRVQRANETGVFLVEIWNGDGSGYASSELRFQPGVYNGRRENSFIGAWYGKNSEFSGSISFVRWYTTLLPKQSRAPFDTVAVPADLLHVDFEGAATKDASQLSLALALEGTGPAVYLDSPTYKPVLALGAGYSTRAGQEATLDFSASFASSGDGEIADLTLEQLAGPASLSIERRGLVANTVLPVAGTYYLRATIRDSAGLEATGVTELSAIATDPEGRVILADDRVEQVIGPMLRSGASPWPWFDTTELQVGDALLSAIEPTPGAPLAGKIAVSTRSNRITGDGTRFLTTFKCDGSDNLAVHYPISFATSEQTGLRVYNVVACASDTELTINPPYDATRIDWRNVTYGRVTNEENARWYSGSNNWNYYDAVLAYYRLYYRTGRDSYREMARTLADRWWKYPLDEGRACESGYWCVAPRTMALLGLMLRANDGRPELWPPILDLANRNYASWIATSVPDTATNVYDIREAGYVSWWQTAIASLHPDEAVRERALRNAENGFRRFWKSKQLPDGSWRMDIAYACSTCGYEGQGTLPWQMAFPLHGIMALHRLNGDPEVLASIQKAGDFLRRYGIDDQCRGMYYDLFYTKCPGGNCGQCPFGTCGKYNCEKNGAYGGNDSRTLANATHSLFGYLYNATGDESYRITGDDLFSANLGGGMGGPGADGGSGHYNDVVKGGVAPSFLAKTYLSKEFAFVGGAGGAQNYLAWRLGKTPGQTWADVDVPFDLSVWPGATLVRVIVVQPSGAQEVFHCTESPCKVRMDQRQGNHLLVLQYLSEDGLVLRQDDAARVAFAVKLNPVRVLSVMEADRITGPAKNLLRFGVAARPEVELTVATYLRGGAVSNGFLDAARSAGLAAHAIPERGRFDWNLIAALNELIDRVRPDLVQTHNTKSHLLMRLSGAWRRTPWIGFHHGYTSEDVKQRLYNQCDRWSLRRPGQLVTVCSPFADQLAGYGQSRESIEIVPNAVEAPRPVAEVELVGWRERLKLHPGEPVLAVIGRLSSEKGQHVLIDALSRLRERSWRLLLAGDGIARQRLQEQARAAGLEERIEWLGLLADVRPVYALASVFVLPSLSEGSPNVLLEAMMAGVPVVSTAVGGVPETVTHEESALLVPPSDPAALAAAVGRLLEDRALAARLAAAALARTADFSPEAYIRRMRAVYDRVLALPSEG